MNGLGAGRRRCERLTPPALRPQSFYDDHHNVLLYGGMQYLAGVSAGHGRRCH